MINTMHHIKISGVENYKNYQEINVLTADCPFFQCLPL